MDPALDLAAEIRASAGDHVRDVFSRTPIPNYAEVRWGRIRRAERLRDRNRKVCGNMDGIWHFF